MGSDFQCQKGVEGSLVAHSHCCEGIFQPLSPHMGGGAGGTYTIFIGNVKWEVIVDQVFPKR